MKQKSGNLAQWREFSWNPLKVFSQEIESNLEAKIRDWPWTN
jgi:hypothetical protein